MKKTQAKTSILDLSYDQDQVKGDAIEIRYVPLSAFSLDEILWDKNPKLHDIDAVYQSIERYGFVDPPKWDKNLNAAQQMGDRTVYGSELSPDYCEVILRRWESLTGKVAELAGHV